MARYTKTIFAAIVACNALAISPAAAQSNCADRDEALAVLAEKHGEHVAFRAVSGRGVMMEVTVNSESGSYSVLMTSPGGPTCMVDEGYNFEVVDEVLRKGSAL